MKLAISIFLKLIAIVGEVMGLFMPCGKILYK